MSNKKKLIERFWAFLLAFVFLMNTNVIEGKVATKIPDEMEPCTVIVYDDSENYTVLEGGEAKIKNFVRSEEPLSEEYPTPFAGMKVVYGSDGLVSEILDKEGNDVPSVQTVKTSSKSITPVAEVLSDDEFEESSTSKTLIAQWGAYPNKLYRNIATKRITGNGRATTFEDSEGQESHALQKGDVATKLAYDNCKCGIKVRVKAKKAKVVNGKYQATNEYLTKTMYKWDAGGMPNAIVDIWKSGVSYWGYTYYNGLSLLGRVYISHDDIKK